MIFQLLITTSHCQLISARLTRKRKISTVPNTVMYFFFLKAWYKVASQLAFAGKAFFVLWNFSPITLKYTFPSDHSRNSWVPLLRWSGKKGKASNKAKTKTAEHYHCLSYSPPISHLYLPVKLETIQNKKGGVTAIQEFFLLMFREKITSNIRLLESRFFKKISTHQLH